MKVKVSLFGTLGQGFPGYQQSEGLEIELPEEATANDLLEFLEVPESQGAAVAVEGRILKADDRIRGGVPVHVLQVIQGG